MYVKRAWAKKSLGPPITKETDTGWCIKLRFRGLDVMTAYRSPKQNNAQYLRFVEMINSLIDPSKPTLICGDFNYDYWKEPNNPLRVMLNKHKFAQIVTVPTTLRGYCIDHAYIRGTSYDHKIYYPYYSDHEAVCVMVQEISTMI